MSNKEKNLTDLTDFTIDVKDIPKSKVEKKKGNDCSRFRIQQQYQDRSMGLVII